MELAGADTNAACVCPSASGSAVARPTCGSINQSISQPVYQSARRTFGYALRVEGGMVSYALSVQGGGGWILGVTNA